MAHSTPIPMPAHSQKCQQCTYCTHKDAAKLPCLKNICRRGVPQLQDYVAPPPMEGEREGALAKLAKKCGHTATFQQEVRPLDDDRWPLKPIFDIVTPQGGRCPVHMTNFITAWPGAGAFKFRKAWYGSIATVVLAAFSFLHTFESDEFRFKMVRLLLLHMGQDLGLLEQFCKASGRFENFHTAWRYSNTGAALEDASAADRAAAQSEDSDDDFGPFDNEVLIEVEDNRDDDQDEDEVLIEVEDNRDDDEDQDDEDEDAEAGDIEAGSAPSAPPPAPWMQQILELEAPNAPMSQSHLYCAWRPGDNSLKVGRAQNVQRRIGDLQREFQQQYILIARWSHAGELEKAVLRCLTQKGLLKNVQNPSTSGQSRDHFDCDVSTIINTVQQCNASCDAPACASGKPLRRQQQERRRRGWEEVSEPVVETTKRMAMEFEREALKRLRQGDDTHVLNFMERVVCRASVAPHAT